MIRQMVRPGRSDVGPASGLAVFLEELGMTWSLKECSEQRGSNQEILRGNYVCVRVRACMSMLNKITFFKGTHYLLRIALTFKHQLNIRDTQLCSPGMHRQGTLMLAVIMI